MDAAEQIKRKIVILRRRLREGTVPSTPADALNALNAVSQIDMFDYWQFYFALRSALVKDVKYFDIFNVIFQEIFLRDSNKIQEAILADGARSPQTNERTTLIKQIDISKNRDKEGDWEEESEKGNLLASWKDEPGALSEDPSSVTEASIYSTVGVAGMGESLNERNVEVKEIMRSARKLRRLIATKPGMRYRRLTNGSTIDLRQTLHRMVKDDTLAFRNRKKSRTKIVILADISGSMKQYAPYFVQMMYGLQRVIPKCEMFVFGTDLVNVTSYLKGNSLEEGFDAISHLLPSLNGGTKIGLCLSQLIVNHAFALDKHTVPIILSDGWDTGDIELLRESLSIVKQRTSGFLLWLNPLLDDPQFEPTCIGMCVAIPYIDVLASSSILKSSNKFMREIELCRLH